MDVEMRVIVYSFLGLQILLVFGVLRLFNAIVTANRLLIKLRESIGKLDSRILSLEKKDVKNVGDLKISLNSVSSSIKQLINKLSTFYEGITLNTIKDRTSSEPKRKPNNGSVS